MEAPRNLNGYFGLVDDFFKKTFREDATLFLSMKTRQYSANVDNNRSGSIEAAGEPTVTTRDGPAANATTTHMTFSPRMWFNRDGTALGKVKLCAGLIVPHIARFESALALASDGVVTGAAQLKELIDGLDVSGRVAANTISPASRDVSSLKVQYQHKDFYFTNRYQRNGLGSSNLLVDSGATFLNILAGAGFERQRLSYLEQRDDGQEQFDVMYAGIGFTGVDWTMAAKLTRTSESWNAARLAFLQRLSPSTTVACSYNFDINESTAHVALGFTQGFRLRVPWLVQPSYHTGGVAGETSSVGWYTVAPFVVACKAESSGLFATTIRGYFINAVRWGIVVQKNALQPASPVRLGLIISMEKDWATNT